MTPTLAGSSTACLASSCAELMWRIVDRVRRGVFHCCGGEAVGRWRLAETTAEIFGLDESLLREGRPDPRSVTAAPVPYDTSLTAGATARALDVELPSVRELLVELRHELETGSLVAAVA